MSSTKDVFVGILTSHCIPRKLANQIANEWAVEMSAVLQREVEPKTDLSQTPAASVQRCEHCELGRSVCTLTDGSVVHELADDDKGLAWCVPCTARATPDTERKSVVSAYDHARLMVENDNKWTDKMRHAVVDARLEAIEDVLSFLEVGHSISAACVRDKFFPKITPAERVVVQKMQNTVINAWEVVVDGERKFYNSLKSVCNIHALGWVAQLEREAKGEHVK